MDLVPFMESREIIWLFCAAHLCCTKSLDSIKARMKHWFLDIDIEREVRTGGAAIVCFFAYETQLPKGTGFTLFGSVHIAWLVGILAVIALAALWVSQRPAYRQRKISKAVALVLCAMIVAEKAILTFTGHLSVYNLPLHLCELSPLLYLLFVWRPWDWLGQVIYVLCFPGAAAALLFPDWNAYPPWNFMNWNSFLLHGLLVLFPILQLIEGRLRPQPRSIWKVWLFLGGLVPPIWLFNRIFGTNYFFLNAASPQSPLAWMWHLTGTTWYLLGYLLLAAGVMMGMLLPWVGKQDK